MITFTDMIGNSCYCRACEVITTSMCHRHLRAGIAMKTIACLDDTHIFSLLAQFLDQQVSFFPAAK